MPQELQPFNDCQKYWNQIVFWYFTYAARGPITHPPVIFSIETKKLRGGGYLFSYF